MKAITVCPNHDTPVTTPSPVLHGEDTVHPEDAIESEDTDQSGDKPLLSNSPLATEEPIADVSAMPDSLLTADSTVSDKGSVGDSQSGKLSAHQADRIAEFEKLDEVVKDHIRSFKKAGNAIIKIMAENLWDVAYSGWEQYRKSLIGYNDEHIRRLVFAANFAKLVQSYNEANPKQNIPVPECEWPIRAIPVKLDDYNKIALWKAACLKSAEGTPTHTQIEEVRKKMFPAIKKSEPEKKKEEVAALLKNMMTLLDVKASHDQIQIALNRLIKVLKIKMMDDLAYSKKNSGEKKQGKLAAA